jgi:hypothetical protein
MRRVITACAFALAIGGTVAAQDSTTKSKTTVNGDDTHTVVMRGCLQQSPSGFTLMGTIVRGGDDATIRNKTKTDVDDHDTTVKSKTKTSVDDDHGVATSGVATAYFVTPRSGVDLVPHAGQDVELTAIIADPRNGGDKDAKVEIKERGNVDREHAPDSKIDSDAKLKIERGAGSQVIAMAVKPLGRSCSF